MFERILLFCSKYTPIEIMPNVPNTINIKNTFKLNYQLLLLTQTINNFFGTLGLVLKKKWKIDEYHFIKVVRIFGYLNTYSRAFQNMQNLFSNLSRCPSYTQQLRDSITRRGTLGAAYPATVTAKTRQLIEVRWSVHRRQFYGRRRDFPVSKNSI